MSAEAMTTIATASESWMLIPVHRKARHLIPDAGLFYAQ
jgi:hypothetical protein